MRVRTWWLPLACAAVVGVAAGEDVYRGTRPVLLEEVRAGFKQAPDSVQATRKLIDLLDGALPADAAAWPPVFRAYRAALEALLGKHAHAPWTKYRHIKAGLARFAGLVEAHPDSIEIRMLRFSACRTLPDVFGQGTQAEGDLAALVELFEQAGDSRIPAAQRRGYIQWILEQGQPSPDQRVRLEKLLDP